VKAARQHGIAVCNVPTYGTDSVAQFTFALLLELCHHVGLHNDSVKAGEWARCPDFCYWKTPLIELVGKTMAIIGYGRIGKRTAEIARAFGLNVLGLDVGDSFETAIRTADIVSLHCPLTDQTRGMVNQKFLQQMKRSAFLINTSRGPLVVERDLADALNAGTIAGAAVDVVSTEPIKPDNPLLTAKNCIVTPHIAWCALEARRRITQVTADNIASFFAGKPINVVN
jgi:glycerate dehydrogenase